MTELGTSWMERHSLLHDTRLGAASVLLCEGVWPIIFRSKASIDSIRALRKAFLSNWLPTNTSPDPLQQQLPKFLEWEKPIEAHPTDEFLATSWAVVQKSVNPTKAADSLAGIMKSEKA